MASCTIRSLAFLRLPSASVAASTRGHQAFAFDCQDWSNSTMNSNTTPRRFVDDHGNEVEIDHRSDTHVHYFAQGGGFVRKMATADFERRYQPAPDAPRPYLPIKVAFDWMDENASFDAFSNGDRWNGWAMPYFTKEVGLELCKVMDGLTYDERQDTFRHENDPEEAEGPDLFGSAQIIVDGKEQTLYGIGTGYWTWDKVEPEEKPAAERPA